MVYIFSRGGSFKHISADGKRDIVETLDTVTYLICQNNDVTREDFQKIITSRNVPTKLFRAADQNGDGYLTLHEVTDFLIILSEPP